MFETMLMTTDGSKLSQKAVQEAIQFAKTTNAEFVALHVCPKFPGSPHGVFGPSGDVREEAGKRQSEAAAEKLFDEMSKRGSAVSIGLDKELVQSDDVFDQVIAVAQKKECELICVASHGGQVLALLRSYERPNLR